MTRGSRLGRVLVTARHFALDDQAHDYLRDHGCEIVTGGYDGSTSDASLSGTELVEALDGVDAAIGAARFSAEVLKQAPSLRAICRRGVGYEKVDVPAATAQGIVVTITPGVMDGAVAEHAAALMFAVTRRTIESHHSVLSGKWIGIVSTGLEHKILGIIGLGRIGRRMAEIGRGLGMRVIAYDISPNADAGVQLVSLRELLQQADVISIHAALTDSSRHLIGSAEIQEMKSSAIVINTARGGVVDEAALLAAVESAAIAGAGLDTFEIEPPDVSRLRSAENLVLSPHSAGYTREALSAANLMAAQNAVAVLEHRYADVAGIVNPDVLPTRAEPAGQL